MKNQLNENHKRLYFWSRCCRTTFAEQFLTLNMILKFFVIMKERKDI